jgi:hypothetical protein
VAVKYTNIAKPSNIYPNWDFWFENIPPGNPEYLLDAVVKTMIFGNNVYFWAANALIPQMNT